MGLVSGSYPNLLNGVSQQDSRVALNTQGRVCTNAYPSVVQGLGKRPPSRYVARLGYTPTDTWPFVHWINRDTTEQYVLYIKADGTCKVWDLAGTAYTVSHDATAKSYLVSTKPVTQIRAMTISDTTFLVNRTKTVAMGSTTAAGRRYAIAWVRAGNYTTSYTLKIDSSSFTHTTADAGTAGAVGLIKTNVIAEALKVGIAALLGGSYTVSRYGSVLKIEKNFGDITTAIGFENSGSQGLKVLLHEAQRFADLPPDAPHGYLAQVKGDENEAGSYWVQANAASRDGTTSIGPCQWIETVGPGQANSFDSSTMPVILKRIPGSPVTFSLELAPWADRLVGTTAAASNPDPSFVGKKIQDVFLHHNRLGFLADMNVVMSESGQVYNFWKTTQLTLKDSDVIDITTSFPRIAALRHAVPYGSDMLVAGETAQFLIRHGETLSPRTVSSDFLTAAEMDPNARPVNVDNTVLFGLSNTNYTNFRELQVDPQTLQKITPLITGHVPQYVSASPLRASVCYTDNLMLWQTETDRDKLFLYKWLFANGDKLQSSWSKWTFGDGIYILGAEFFGSVLWLLTRRNVGTGNDNLFLEKIDVSPGAYEQYLTYLTYLDCGIPDTSLTVTYDGGTGRTTLTGNPIYAFTSAPSVVARASSDSSWVAGTEYPVVASTANSVSVSGDLRGKNLWVGRKFTTTWQFAPPWLKAPTDNGSKAAVTTGRLEIATLSVNYADTMYTDLIHTPLYGSATTYPFTATTPSTGTLRSGINCKNDEVTLELSNPSHYPSWWTGAEWEGAYTDRTKRV